MSQMHMINIDGELEWKVVRVRASRFHYNSSTKLIGKLKGYDKNDQWYPADNFKGSPDRLAEFHRLNPDAAGPPKRLSEWQKAFAEGFEAPEHPDGNLPAREGIHRARRQFR